MATSQPIVVLVHGAWQTVAQWEPLAKGLTSKGHTVVRPQNASSGPDAAAIRGKTYEDDVAVIRSAMEPHLAAGKEIVLVCHSYGGIPTSAAAEGYQVHERRARGLSGGVKHVIYLAAFAFPSKGLSLVMALGGDYAPFMLNKDGVIALGDGARDALYNGTEPGLTDRILASQFLQSAASFEKPQNFAAADVSVPKTYVLAEQDHALPPDAQENLIKALDNINVVRVPAGHCVHLNPEVIPKLVEVIGSVAQS